MGRGSRVGETWSEGGRDVMGTGQWRTLFLLRCSYGSCLAFLGTKPSSDYGHGPYIRPQVIITQIFF